MRIRVLPAVLVRGAPSLNRAPQPGASRASQSTHSPPSGGEGWRQLQNGILCKLVMTNLVNRVKLQTLFFISCWIIEGEEMPN